MAVRYLRSRGCSALIGFVCVLVAWRSANAVQRTWIGGNVDWVDGAGNNANWSGSDEPDSDDEALFNTANTVQLGSNNAVNGLTLSGGIDLFTNELDLTVDGLVQLSGAGTNLFLGGAAADLNADDVTINADASIELRGVSLLSTKKSAHRCSTSTWGVICWVTARSRLPMRWGAPRYFSSTTVR